MTAAGTPGVTVADVRAFALTLPRSYEALVFNRIKFKVGSAVYLTFSRDETELGFAFPKEEREMLVRCDPEKFFLPKPTDLRYQWAMVRPAALDVEEMRELVLDAWLMVAPLRVRQAYAAEHGIPGV